MGLSGYTDTLPAEVLLNPAIVMIGTAKLGVTRGGVSWDPETEISSIAFDGKRSNFVRGTERVTKRGGKMTGTILQIATAAQIQKLEPGATTATGGTGVTTIITPKDAGLLFDDANYLVDVRAIWALKGGTYFAIYLPVALCPKYDIKGADNNEAEISFEFDAVLDPADGDSLGKSPFLYELRSALPAA